jgi:hypothetical protein
MLNIWSGAPFLLPHTGKLPPGSTMNRKPGDINYKFGNVEQHKTGNTTCLSKKRRAGWYCFLFAAWSGKDIRIWLGNQGYSVNDFWFMSILSTPAVVAV